MKGTLQKTQRGWQIAYEVLNSLRIISVHPNDVENLDEDDGGEVYFEKEIHEDGKTYAVLYPEGIDNNDDEISNEEINAAANLFFPYKDGRIKKAMWKLGTTCIVTGTMTKI